MMLNKIQKRYINHIISDAKLQSHGIINMHRINTKNSGDLMCAPYLYFKELNAFEKIDVSGYLSYNLFNTLTWAEKVKKNDIVLGGGGLLDRPSFKHSIDVLKALLEKGRKIVPWGIGHNNPSNHVSSDFKSQIKNFKLIGIRDYDVEGTEWVPCVSCMNEVFDNDYKETIEIGVIGHERIRIAESISLSGLPFLANNADFEKIIEFIGNSHIIITNSYHAMYWSMLMQKKVIVLPNSSKMFSFKYKPTICNDLKDYKKCISEAIIYEGLLEECREINKNFAAKVFNYLNLS